MAKQLNLLNPVEVIQSNVITNASFSFTSLEANIFVVVVKACNRQGDNEMKFKISTITDHMGISHRNMPRIKEAIISLQKKIITFTEGQKWTSVPLISGARIVSEFDTVSFTVSPYLRGYLYDLSENFSSYYLDSFFRLKFKYSKRLYMCFSSWSVRGLWYVQLSVLRKMFKLTTKYKNWRGFFLKVLEPSINEINDNTELHVTIDGYKKDGKKIVAVSFSIVITGMKKTKLEEAQRIKLARVYKFSEWQLNRIYLYLKPFELQPLIHTADIKRSNNEVRVNPGAYLYGILRNYGVDFKKDVDGDFTDKGQTRIDQEWVA